MKIFFVFTVFFLSIHSIYSQNDEQDSSFTVSGYVDIYYVYDFNKPENNKRPDFIYSYNRHNEVNVNLGFIRGSYKTDRVRANIALMTGTYANSNLANEPGILKNILEGNGGVKISRTKTLWLDAGVFGSHIGFESAISKDSWNLTRSILADNTPYYEAGLKISYTNENEKWFVSAMMLNGWQRIQRVSGNSLPSFGTQLTFKPGSRITLNSSSFIGTDTPDSARLRRYFHNFYCIAQIADKVAITLGFDYGIQQKQPESNLFNRWFSPVLIARFTFNEKFSADVRAEYYQDQHEVIITTASAQGFRTTGISANADYKITNNALCRIELRSFNSRDGVFIRGRKAVDSNTFISTSIAISF